MRLRPFQIIFPVGFYVAISVSLSLAASDAGDGWKRYETKIEGASAVIFEAKSSPQFHFYLTHSSDQVGRYKKLELGAALRSLCADLAQAHHASPVLRSQTAGGGNQVCWIQEGAGAAGFLQLIQMKAQGAAAGHHYEVSYLTWSGKPKELSAANDLAQELSRSVFK